MAERTDAGDRLVAALITLVDGELRRRGWSKRRLAVEMGTGPSTILAILNGRASPTLESVARIAGAFELEASVTFSEPKDGKP